MDKKELISLIRKYLKGKATSEERRFVEAWYREMDSSQTIESILTPTEVKQLEHQLFCRIQERIAGTLVSSEPTVPSIAPVRQLEPVAPSRTRLVRRMAAAAAVLLLAITGGYLLYYRYDDAGLTTFYSQPGKVSKIMLGDGSMAWLNADSRLTFSKSFGRSGDREIFLEGEAYFEVAKDPGRPFLVHAAGLTTHVLGTKFNVSAYGPRPVEVTLLEGKVMVSAASTGNGKQDTVYLTPNQKASFTADRLQLSATADVAGRAADRSAPVKGPHADVTGELVKASAGNAEESAAWRNGLLVFREVALKDVMESLGRKYNIQIKSDTSLLSKPVTAAITGDLSAEDALLEVTRQLKRDGKKDRRLKGAFLQYRKEGAVYYIE